MFIYELKTSLEFVKEGIKGSLITMTCFLDKTNHTHIFMHAEAIYKTEKLNICEN